MDRHSPEPFSNGNSNYIHYWPGFFGAWGVANFQRAASLLSCKWWPCAGLWRKCNICLGHSKQPAESWCLVQLMKTHVNGEGLVAGLVREKWRQNLTEGKIVLDVEGELRFLCFPLVLLSIDVLRCKPKVVLAAARFNPVVLQWVSV